MTDLERRLEQLADDFEADGCCDARSETVREALRELQVLRVEVECDKRDPRHKNCRNVETQLARQREVVEAALAKAEATAQTIRDRLDLSHDAPVDAEYLDCCYLARADLRKELLALSAAPAPTGTEQP
jgi:hypothetical protein